MLVVTSRRIIGVRQQCFFDHECHKVDWVTPCCRAEFRLLYICSFDFVLLFFFRITVVFKGLNVRWFTNVWDQKINIYKWLQVRIAVSMLSIVMCSSHYSHHWTGLAHLTYAKSVIASGELNMKVSVAKCRAKTQRFLENYRVCGLINGVMWLFWTPAAAH